MCVSDAVHVCVVLQEMPEVNVVWSSEGPQALGSIHICVAVATERGLMTPIIRDAADKGLTEIAHTAKVIARVQTHAQITHAPAENMKLIM